MYREFFLNPDDSANDVPVIEYHKNNLSTLNHLSDGRDTGVEFEAAMNPTQLAENLGFVEGIPLLFNDFRRSDGLDPWTCPDAFINNAENSQFLSNLNLHWHQLAGVHATVRKCLQEQPSLDPYIGVLISDEVGLGKTYQAATFIAFLADAVMRQKTAVQIIPPILRKQLLL